ncbi:MAG TPA: MFS transporter [Stellaceae bacterium]|nr:MFS transporter [Stellaceae bacterium]
MRGASVHSFPKRYTVLARIDRLPPSRHIRNLVARIASGGWFEFYELFMPGFISVGLTGSGIYTLESHGLLDLHSFPSFLASFFLGMLISTGVFGFVSDALGRRQIFVYSMVLYSAAQFLIACFSNAVTIDILRLVAGFAVGMQLVNNDSYITELTPRALRGRYMALAFVFILTAVPVAAGLATLLVPHAPLGLAGWRWVVAIGAASGLAVWFLQRNLPESPRWLEIQGRSREADAIMSEIEHRIMKERGSEMLPEPEGNGPRPVLADTGDWHEMFGRFYLPRTLILSVFQFAQTIAVFGFTSFVPILLVHQGFTVVKSLEYTAMIVLMAPVGAILGTFLAERIERKWQLVATALLVGIAGALFANAHDVTTVVITGGAIALGNNWMITVFHPYAAELFPTRIRARAIGFTFCWSRVSSIFVGYWVSALLAAYGNDGVFAMIAAAMAAIIIGIGAFGPATNGKGLETLSP